MKRLIHGFKLLTTALLMSGIGNFVAGATRVGELVCEYHTDPIGIDVEKPRLSWKIFSDRENVTQSAFQIRVAELPSNLKKNALVWNSGKVNSGQSVNIEYNGPKPKSMQRLYWQVRVWDHRGKATPWSEPAFWETGILHSEQWIASWITMPNEKKAEESKPCHYLRREFAIAKKVRSARVYVSALGLYELYLNGIKVGDELFTPGWTSYKNRIQYQTYDVTEMVRSKVNVLGAILGDGWYRGNIGFNKQHNYYGDQLALIVQLCITYTDGTVETIVTDDSWKATTGPILSSDIYNGETYDARLEMPGWASPGFNDSLWSRVEIKDHSRNVLVAPQSDPVRAVMEINPVKIIITPKGETVFDMGQNMVGWVRLKVKGNAGDVVSLKFAEVLDRDGNFYTENLREAKVTDTYVLKGEGEEVYEPRFTFHGFRFVKIEGLSDTPSLENITGVVVHSDMQPTGHFTCSNPLINQLQQNIQWGQRGNFLDVPTDCPQRNERLGWTGDAQVFSPTAAFNFNVAPFYTKWMKDLAADQLPNGKVPHVIPDVLRGEGGSTAWADAALIVPWNTYLAYGDKRILEVQYSSMKAWVDYMKNRAGDNYLWIGDNHFGDWLAFPIKRSGSQESTTEKDLIATAYYAYSTQLLANTARVIGKKEDAEEYELLSEKVKNAFVNEFVTTEGDLISQTQTAYSLALAFNLLPDKSIPQVAANLADDVRKFQHLTTGFVGTPLLCKALSDNGYEDLAFMLLMRKEYPSWLYPVTKGATTIWERWDGQKPDGTFQDPGMNSFNHYAYGAIGEWLYNYIAGIQIDPKAPGYKHFFLAPHLGGGLTYAEAVYKSMYGEIRSQWNIEDNQMNYEVKIPVNTTATVTLPSALLEDVLFNGSSLKSIVEIEAWQNEKGVSLKLGSGEYIFNYPL
ncbi:family 78 glycoside hydrolase catalytic domain [Thermophagus sp. OGC60D27]|uniref:family 78 glycoside hydrolase catalytic domain n=1 Tax=Thermophagus sp. OGC60D27 TaxID=3458415 RepID=UPI004037B2CC